jgi:hypothetical protein
LPGLDKMGMSFNSVRLIGQELYGGGGGGEIKVARSGCGGWELGRSGGKLCALCGVGCLTGLSSWGFSHLLQ